MISNLTQKWWFKWLVAGVVLRLILMPITLHPDLWGHSSTAYFFAYKGVFNIYEHLASLTTDHALVKTMGVADIFIYPPLTYFTLGIFRLLVRPFSDPNFIPMLWSFPDNIYNHSGFYLHLFLYKLPYLFIDILLAFTLAGLFDKLSRKKAAFILWMFNPLTLYATFMVGQLDLLPTFFTVLSLYFAKKNKYSWSLLALGIGGSYKMYPLLFLLPAAFVFGSKFKERLRYVIIGLLPFIISIAPFLSSPSFRQMVLFSPKSQKMLFMGWHVSGAEVIYPFILLLSFVYFFAYYTKVKFQLGHYFLAILLLIFSVTHYHPQWFLWVTPFLIWHLVRSNYNHFLLVVVLFVSWLVLTLFFEPSLSYGLFNPLWPELIKGKGFSEFVSSYSDVFQLKSLIRSTFAGASLYLLYGIAKESKRSAS